MILVNRKFIVFLMIFSTVLLGAGGYASWYFLMRAYGNSFAELKFFSEQMLFIALICMVINVSVFLVMLSRSLNFSRELAKQVKLSRNGNYSPDSALRRLGKTGIQIADIIYEMNSLSDKKSLKIGALHALSAFLINQIGKKMVILSATGVVQYASAEFLKETGFQKNECINKELGELLKMPDIAEEIRTVFDVAQELKNKENDYTLSPIISYKRNTVLAVCVYNRRITDFVDERVNNDKKNTRKSLGNIVSKGFHGLLHFRSAAGNKKDRSE